MNTTTFGEPRLASEADQQTILNLIKDAAEWLRTKGTSQWATPWPSHAERDERVRHSIDAGCTWVVWDGPTAVATVTSHRDGLPMLWTEAERRVPAVYLHRLIVGREYSGLGVGAWLVDWATRRAVAEYGAVETRIDVWTDNRALHRYYLGIGFGFVRVAQDCGTYPSCALFRRPVPDA